MFSSDHHSGPPLIFGSMVNILAREGVLLVSQSAILSFLLVLIGSYPIVLTNIWWNLMGRVILTFRGLCVAHKVILPVIQGESICLYFWIRIGSDFSDFVKNSKIFLRSMYVGQLWIFRQKEVSPRHPKCNAIFPVDTNFATLPQPTPSIPDILLCNKT